MSVRKESRREALHLFFLSFFFFVSFHLVSHEVAKKVEVEYVPEKTELEDVLNNEFRKIFEKFSFGETAGSEEKESKDDDAQKAAKKENDDLVSEEEEQDIQQKEKKLQRQMKISELKQGKRCIEKQPFQLPDFISATGIEKIRQAYIEKVDNKKLKQKQREHMQPKMGKMNIDYQVLHDAFFKYQTKPKLTSHCDLYFEGKEFERYRPPPSYPLLKIPGLNAPIPLGTTFVYPGGWGKPPVDEEEPLDKTKHWGDLEEEEEEV